MRKAIRAAVEAAVNEPVTDWIDDPGVTIEQGAKTTIVYSARMPAEWSPEIEALTTSRRLANPNQLIKALVREALDRAATGEVQDPATAQALSHLDAARRALLERDSQHRQAA